MCASGAPCARPFANARGACAARAHPIALHRACESHAGCMKRAIALAVAEENASLVVSATAEHARIGPDHCRRSVLGSGAAAVAGMGHGVGRAAMVEPRNLTR